MRADDRGLARRFVGQPGVYHVMDGAISTFESSPMRKARRAAEDELETIVLAKAQEAIREERNLSRALACRP